MNTYQKMFNDRINNTQHWNVELLVKQDSDLV